MQLHGGAGYGNRTRLAGLGSQSITTMLSPPGFIVAEKPDAPGRAPDCETLARETHTLCESRPCCACG